MHVLLHSRPIVAGLFYYGILIKNVLKCLLFYSLKNTHCCEEIWSKATNKNEVTFRKFCDFWALPQVPDYTQV